MNHARVGLQLSLLAALTVAAYLPALAGGFVWDDLNLAVDSPQVRAPDGIYRLWLTTEPMDYWPVTYSTFWIERRLWGLEPLPYHVVNVLLHLANAVLVWRILHLLGVPAAWPAALVFAVHPVQVEATAWIFQRKTLLSALFTFASLERFLQASRKRRLEPLLASIGLFGLALLSKSAPVFFPLALVLVLGWRHERLRWRVVMPTLPFFAVAGVLGGVALWFQQVKALGGDEIRDESAFERLLGAATAIGFYLRQAVYPFHLSFVYPRWEIAIGQPAAWLPMVALALVAGICLKHRRSWGHGVLVAGGWYVLMLLPVLGFVDIYYLRYALVADHYQYLAFPALVALAASLAVSVWQRVGPTWERSSRLVGAAAATLLVVGLASLTYRQGHLYANEETLWRATLERYPEAWLAHHNLAAWLEAQGKLEEAVPHYLEVIALHPQAVESLNNLGVIAAEKGDEEQAMAWFHRALALKPFYGSAHVNLAALLRSRGDYRAARTHLEHALAQPPGHAAAHLEMGEWFMATGAPHEALRHYGEALRRQAGQPTLHLRAGQAAWMTGAVTAAASHYASAVTADPASFEAHFGLATALAATGALEPATRHYERAAVLAPNDPRVFNDLGAAYRALGRLTDALRCYRRALELDPRRASAHLNLANALVEHDEEAEAIRHYREAIRLEPSDPRSRHVLAWVLATSPHDAVRNGAEAVALAEDALRMVQDRDPEYGDTLAAAYAAAGRFDEAVQAAEEALRLAQNQGLRELAAEMASRQRLYAAGRPYRREPKAAAATPE